MNAFSICAGEEVNYSTDDLKYLQAHSLIPYVMGINAKKFEKKAVRCTLLKCKINYNKSINELISFLTVLDRNSINYCILKGISISESYHYPYTRLMSDHDILVQPDDLIAAEKILVDLEYVKILETHHDKTYILNTISGTHRIELHFQLFDYDRNRYDENLIACVWDNIDNLIIYGYSFNVPNPAWQFKYMIFHACKHLNNRGFGIRYILDIVHYVNKHNLDFSEYLSYFSQSGIIEFYKTVISLCYRYFHMNCERPTCLNQIDHKAVDWLENYILESGLHGHANKSRSMALTYERFSKDVVKDGKNLLHWFFPSKDTMYVQFSYVEKHPILLPIAWIQRWFKLLLRNDLSIRQKFIIFTKDDAMLKERDQMLKKFGLR